MPSTLSSIYLPPFPPKKLAPPLPDEATSAIADLRERWHRIYDLDRALAVHEIIQLGVSRRRLARELGFSEGLIRHLLKALEASSADQELARRNEISTNELIRRANRRPEISVAETPVRAEVRPVRPGGRLPVGPPIRPLPLLKRNRRTAATPSTQIPPAAVKLLAMWRNYSGY